jgi:hypothetical protein
MAWSQSSLLLSCAFLSFPIVPDGVEAAEAESFLPVADGVVVADFRGAEGDFPEEAAVSAAAAQEGIGNMHPREFKKKLHHDNVVAAIREAEKRTTSEIRVYVTHKHVETPVIEAQKEFVRLGMAKSPHRNGVLIFVAPRAHKFAVIGDKGVHEKCGDEFWRKLADAMTEYFRKSEFTEGIVHGVKKAGELLAEHFPK